MIIFRNKIREWSGKLYFVNSMGYHPAIKNGMKKRVEMWKTFDTLSEKSIKL